MGMEDDFDLDVEGAADAIGAELGFQETQDDDADLLDSGRDEENAEGEDEEATDQDPKPDETSDPAKEEDPEAKPDAPSVTAPRTWRAEAAKEFASLSPVVQAEILKREEDMFQGIEQYKVDAGFGDKMRKGLGEFLPLLEQHHIDPGMWARDIAALQRTLAFGSPEQRLGVLTDLAKQYNVDLGGQQKADEGEGFSDPQVTRLQEEINALKSKLSQNEERQQQARQADVQSQVEAFSKDPSNVYFDEVANDMAILLRSGEIKDLKQAYDKAVWMNPVTRQKAMEQQAADRAAKMQEEEAKKVEAARKASAANVKPRATRGGAAAAKGSMEDTLAETYRAITSRTADD